MQIIVMQQGLGNIVGCYWLAVGGWPYHLQVGKVSVGSEGTANLIDRFDRVLRILKVLRLLD